MHGEATLCRHLTGSKFVELLVLCHYIVHYRVGFVIVRPSLVLDERCGGGIIPQCLIPECLIVKMSNPKMSNPKMSNEVLIRSKKALTGLRVCIT